MKQPELDSALRQLAEKVAAVPPPDREAAVMAEFDRAWQVRNSAPRTTHWMAVGGALAASLLAGVLLLRPQPLAPDPATAQTSGQPSSQEFYPIPYTPPLEPYERVLVVQTNVPVTELIAAGFHVQTSDPGGSVRADVMVSQDGRPRAIRPVVFNVSNRSNTR